MKGLLARMSCELEGRGKRFKIALGEDGNVYPLSGELVDLIEGWKAALALGFRERDLLRDPCFSVMHDYNHFQVSRIVCQKNVLPMGLLCWIALKWTQRYPQMMDSYHKRPQPTL